jgi:hypothetical protein
VSANAFAEAGGVGDTCRVKLDDYLDSFQHLLDHLRHQTAQETLVELIGQLRACTNVNDGYEFQQVLLSQILAVEEDRHAFRRAIKRMALGADGARPGDTGHEASEDRPRTAQSVSGRRRQARNARGEPPQEHVIGRTPRTAI